MMPIVFLVVGILLAECTANPLVPGSSTHTGTPVANNPPSGPTALPTSTGPAAAPLTGQLVFCSEESGQWNLNRVSPDGDVQQTLTDDGTSRSPSISPDGKQIAFESHRDGNWEIYTMDTAGEHVTRLTRAQAFDGSPNWSPDGKQIAFVSMRQGDPDIWVMNADGTHPTDLTETSPAVDDAPAWSPNGRWIAFTSWRTGTAQLFVVSPDGQQITNLSQNKFDDESPAWSPDGRQIAFVSDRDGQRAIYVADFSIQGLKNARRLTFSGWDEFPAWSPDGKYLAFVSPRPSRQPIYFVPASGGIPRALSGDSMYVRSVAWGSIDAPVVDNRATNPPAPSLYPEPSPETPAKLIPLKDVYLAPSYGEMSDRVSGSFQALRARVKAEAGWDFLGVLSDMTRQLNSECGDGCQFLSWHKTGRAVDTRMSVDSGGVPLLEIVREDQLGETYWRIYLRAARQDGTMGEPLTEPPWDWTNWARWTLAPHEGGALKPIPIGYYVDFTELAREYGWERISSYDDPTLSWKENITGMEFWHYQKREGLTWYVALRELYSSATLADILDWNALLRQGQDAYLMRLKGVPAPPSAWRWFALFP